MKELKKYPVLMLFFGLLILFTAVDMIYPDREYSELENTKLDQRPQFNMSRLLNNQWTADYGEYVKEQFMFRDTWIDLQSRSESLLMRKVENGGMLVGKVNGKPQMFTKMFTLKNNEKSQLPKNISAVVGFAEKYDNMTFMLVPSASVVYANEVPAKAPLIDENAMLDEIFAQVGAKGSVLDLRDLFAGSKEDYLYYRTDHHWTTLGAYRAYRAYCESIGKEPWDSSAAQPTNVEGFYGTSYSSSRLWNAVPDVLTYYEELDCPMTVYDAMGENSFKERQTAGLYDQEKLSVRDKYGMFLYGNNGFSRIEGKGEGSILVIKDSYANCFTPFLTANFAAVDVMDLRYYRFSLDSVIAENQYDQILVLYNFQSFKADSFLPTLLRPSML